MINKKPILILGSNGFLGKNLQEYVIQNNLTSKYIFYLCDKRKVESVFIPESLFYENDLLDYDCLSSLILQVKPSYIINLTGLYGNEDIELIYKINTQISRNILEVLRRNKLENVHTLLVGSAAEYGECIDLPILETSQLNPVNIYGISKKHQTELALYYKQNYNLKVSIGRVFNTVGKYQPTSLSISSFINRLKNLKDGDELITGNIDTKRDFIDISDVISAFFFILESGKDDIYNICTGRSYSIRELLNHIIEKSSKKITIKINEKLIRKNEIVNSFGSNIKLRNVTNWECNVSVYDTLSLLMKNNF